jgi:CRISPR-associated protein Csb1
VDIQTLLEACRGKYSAISAMVELEPVASGKIMPPTYLAAPKSKERAHWTETRVVNGKPTDCVILDSVQSQANRFEEALQTALDLGDVSLPVFRVSFPSHDPITSLTAPHRIYDAWLRHTTLDGVPFRETTIGQAISSAQPQTATALLRYAPTVLLFGGWDSQVNAKTRFSRALVSEIVAIGIAKGQRAASRIDPINLRIQLERSATGGYRPGAKFRASEIGLASVAPHLDSAGGGATAERIEQSIALSFAQLLRLRFPLDGDYTPERDAAGRAVVAALGLFAAHHAGSSGYALRSGCWLRAKQGLEWRLLGPTPDSDRTASISDPKGLYDAAVKNASSRGLEIDPSVYQLEPDPGLIEAVQANPTDAGDTE